MKRKILKICIFLLAAGTLFAGNKPLSLKESKPADEAVGVSVDVEIELTFSNNVTNFSVSENNAACLSLQNSRGEDVEIEIIIPDDQLEPQKKRNYYIKPVSPLGADSRYTVIIAPEFVSKNGSVLGEEVRFTFTTGE